MKLKNTDFLLKSLRYLIIENYNELSGFREQKDEYWCDPYKWNQAYSVKV